MSSSVEHQCEKELIEATRKGDTDSVQKLLDRQGVDVNWKDNYGWTPLMHAVNNNRMNIVKLLLDKGADVNTQSNDGTPLMIATLRGREDIVDMLLEKGAIVDIKDKDYETAIDWARQSGCKDIVDKLEKLEKAHNERCLWKKREGVLQLQIQNLVGQIDQLKQEQKEESKKAENTIASLQTRLEALESKTQAANAKDMNIKKDTKMIFVDSVDDNDAIGDHYDEDKHDVRRSSSSDAARHDAEYNTKMMHDLLLKAHQKIDKQDENSALKDREIISLQEENQGLKNSLLKQQELLLIAAHHQTLPVTQNKHESSLLAAQNHNAVQKLELHVSTEIQKGHVDKQELLTTLVRNEIQKKELLAADDKMTQTQQMLTAEVNDKHTFRVVSEIHNVTQKLELLIAEVVEKQELLTAQIHNAFQQQELLIVGEIDKSYEKQKSRIAAEIHHAIQKHELIFTGKASSSADDTHDSVKKAGIHSLQDEVDPALKLHDVLGHLIESPNLSNKDAKVFSQDEHQQVFQQSQKNEKLFTWTHPETMDTFEKIDDNNYDEWKIV